MSPPSETKGLAQARRLLTTVNKGRPVVDFIESDEQQMLRKAVSELAGEFGYSYWRSKLDAGQTQDELWQALGDAGFIGVNTPTEYGGGGGGIYDLAIVCEEVAAQGCGLLLLVVSPAICATILSAYGSEDQKQQWLPPMASGEKKMVFAITEPDAGSNSHNLATTATRDGDLYRLNGQKYYISGVDEADAILVVTRTGHDESSGRGRLSLFIVPTDTPGLTTRPIEMDVQMPETQFFLFFDDATVPAANLVGTEHDGLRQVFLGLNPERITGAAQAIGAGRFALERAVSYANDRSVWGVPIGSHQGIAHPLAEAKIELEMARLMTQKAAWLHDRGLVESGEAANMAKFSGAEAALKCVDTALQAHGGNGFAAEYGLTALWTATRAARTAPVSREMILNFVAQHSLGLPRSY